MKAVVWKNHQVKLVDVEQPKPGEGESLVRVKLAGVCNTDLEITKGYFDFEGVLGHEFVGVVEQSSDPDFVGKRVVCDINFACRKCDVCQNGGFHHCPERTVLGIVNHNGCFCEYVVVSTQNLVVVPDNVEDPAAVFAEPLAAVLEILEQVHIKEEDPVCILGDGKLGLLIAMVLANAGCNATLVGRHPERLSRLGDNAVNIATKPVKGIYKIVIEATGNPEGFLTAMYIVKPQGKIILKSTYHKPFEFNPAMLVVNEVQVLGSRCGPMNKAVDLLASREVEPNLLIDHTFALSEGEAAIKRAGMKGQLKILIDMSS